MEQKLYSTNQVAELFGLKGSYLRKLRQLRQGPKYIKLNKLVLYDPAEVSEWIAARGREIEPCGLI